MLDIERRQKMVDLVERSNGATVGELSEHFEVSQATVRRDLLQLQKQGLIERAHGGAAPKRSKRAGGFFEPPVLQRSTLQVEEKRAIGRAAAQHAEDGDTIMLGTGTTTAAMVPYLGDYEKLTVITNALNVALELAQYPQVTVVLPGGVLRHSELSMLGLITEDALTNLRADKLFIGSPAVHPEFGLSADDSSEAQSDRALMAAAREITVLADSTKFGRVATMRVAPMARVKRIVTDTGSSSEIAAALRERGVEVEEVQSELEQTRRRPA